MDFTTDEQLMRRIALQDRDAFENLYDRYASRMLGLILGIVRTRTEADDVLQDAFLQIWNDAAKYNERRGAPTSWLCRIARSRAIDAVRKRYTSALRAGALRIEDAENAAELACEREQVQVAVSALEHLNAHEQESIRLAFFGGLTQEEIAEKTSTPLGTVKTRIRRGMMKLRESLNGHTRAKLDE